MRRTPLYSAHKRRGAVFGDWGGFEVAFSFGDADGEALAARRSAALFDVSPRLRLRVDGADRVDFLHRMLTSDVRGLEPGRVQPSLLLTAKGKIVADLLLLRTADAFRIDAEPQAAAHLPAELEKYVIADDVSIADESERFAELSIVGPDAPRIVGEAVGADAAALADGALLERDVAGAPGVVIRRDALGVPEFDVWVAADAAVSLFDALRPRGAKPAGFLAREAVRIESGVPRFGADVDADSLPAEVGLEGAISYTKGCYVGQETIARLKYQGHVNRVLVRVELDATTPPPRFTALFAAAEEREVGRLTSAAASPSARAIVGLAIVRREFSVPGTPLRARLATGDVRATITRTEPGSTPADFSAGASGPARPQGGA
jgi:folate-binding protein YgfZ